MAIPAASFSLADMVFVPPTRISPSQYARVLACPYQSLLTKTTEAKSLPGAMSSGGAAAVGTIVHSMLELAASTDLSSPGTFDTAWQKFLRQKETELSQKGNTNLIPLAYRARGYAVTKLLLRWQLTRMGMPTPPTPGTGLPLGPEQWLEDATGSIGGIADLIRLTASGPEIVDYKTGPIFQLNALAEPEIKPAYAQQLQLYAALFHDKTSRWPTRLLLADLAGNEHEVNFTESDCRQLLDNSRQLLARIQAAVVAANPESLAVPSVAQCRFCQVRPLCRPVESWLAQSESAQL